MCVCVLMRCDGRGAAAITWPWLVKTKAATQRSPKVTSRSIFRGGDGAKKGEGVGLGYANAGVLLKLNQRRVI